jgi:S-layer protein
MAISTNGTVLARVAGALYNTQMSNATYSEVKTLDPASLTDALYARDFANATDTAVATTLVTNLGLSTVAGLVNWVAAQLTAAGSHKGAKIVDLLNGFAQMSADATYGAAATAFNTKVDAALVLSQTTGNAGGTFAAAGTTGFTFALTVGADTGAAFTGSSGDDTFNAAETSAATWTVGDAIDGGAGNDVFNITQTAAITAPTGATVKNVETANLVSGSTATTINTSSWTGLTTLNVTAPAAVTTTAAATTLVNITDSAQAAGAIAVNGGSNVTITASGVTSGTTTVGGTTAAVGNVTITSAASTAGTTGAISVTGGKEISITTSAGNAVNTTVVGGAITVTGDSNTTAVTVKQDNTATASGTVVGKTTAAVVIADKNAASTTDAGTITTVTLKAFGTVDYNADADTADAGETSTINSGALTTLNLSGKGTALTVTNGSLTTPAVTTQALNVTGLTTSGAITLDSDITTLNVTSSTTASTINSLVANGATTLNVLGDAKLTLTGQTLGAVTAINVSNTAGASFGSALPTGTTFTGGTGADTITLSTGFTKAITLGDGDDTVTYATGSGTGYSVAASNGNDTIKMTGAEANAADADSTFNSKFTGFEVLSLTTALDSAGDTTINLAGINGVSKVTTVGVGTTGKTLTLDNIASGGTLTLTSDVTGTGAVAVNVTNATFNVADTFNVNLSKQGILAGGIVSVAGVEAVNVSAADATTTATSGVFGAAAVHTLTLQATSAKSIVVTGNNGLTLTNTGNVAVTSFDASGVVGNDTSDTDTAANLAITFTSAYTGTSAVTIKGGSGSDALTGAGQVDMITAGNGADTVTGGAGNDSIDLTETVAAADTVVFADIATNGIDTIAGFAAGSTGADLAKLVSGSTTNASQASAGVADFATSTNTTLVNGAVAFALTGGNTGTDDIIEITATLSSYGNLGLTGATSGAELLKALSSTDSAATSLTATTADDDFYVVAYQNGNAYLYQVVNDNNTAVVSSEISLVGIFTGVAAGAFASGDFTV